MRKYVIISAGIVTVLVAVGVGWLWLYGQTARPFPVAARVATHMPT